MKSMLLLICIIATLGLQVPAEKINSVNGRQLATTPVCEGKNGVMVAMPESCSGFFFCVDGNAIASSCGIFYRFNSALGICDHPDKVRCNGSSPPSIEDDNMNDDVFNDTVAQDVCLQAAEGYKFAKSKSCTLFYECHDGQAIRRVCPPQKHFNATTKQCQEVGKAQCMFSSYTPMSPSLSPPISPQPPSSLPSLDIITSKPIPIRRPIKATTTASKITRDSKLLNFKLESFCSAIWNNRTLVHPWDCNKFIYCINKKTLVMNCPQGLHFSPKKMRCEWPAISECNSQVL
ncbi:putative chitinase 10 [Haematobia irritans]|uniref:putative chitinase 10 n=1 Tax=Haematobia irritans TaxID=7368 RepID=UPI003F50995E